ncbi:MAG: LysR substrate-binding domain-containing protein [Neisseria sp.]|nr:LysR substrate-binding domain-containing protein [Neisseria sp.]
MRLNDLNDLYLFARAIEEGGFSAAARKLGMPKATFSRRMAKLEERLGVKLVQRSAQHFQPTQIGLLYYQHCAAIRAEAEAAGQLIAQHSSTPRGRVRFSCPSELLELYVNHMLATFVRDYPDIDLEVLPANHPVDIAKEGLDFAIRVRECPPPDSELFFRRFAVSRRLLVAAPDLLPQAVAEPAELQNLPAISHQPEGDWLLQHPKHGHYSLHYQAKTASRNLDLLRRAALAGLGIAVLPQFAIGRELAEGRLRSALPDGWDAGSDMIHAVYLNRRGMLPAVSVLLERLAADFAAVWPSQA